MDWITENIAIGNYLDARDAASEVDAVLCLIENCCSEENERVDVLCLPLVDGPGNDPRLFDHAIDFIHDVVSSNEKMVFALPFGVA